MKAIRGQKYIHIYIRRRTEQNRTEPIILTRNKTRNRTETECFIKNYSKREKKRKEKNSKRVFHNAGSALYTSKNWDSFSYFLILYLYYKVLDSNSCSKGQKETHEARERKSGALFTRVFSRNYNFL